MGGSLSEKLIGVAGTFDIGEVRVVGVRKWEASKSELNEGDAERPYVGFNRVFGALNALRLRIGDRINFVG